jgi:hypothetical protein
MKSWEIIANRLSKAGWSWGCVATINSNGQTIFVADAHRDDGKRFLMNENEKLSAFLQNLKLPALSLLDGAAFFPFDHSNARVFGVCCILITLDAGKRDLIPKVSIATCDAPRHLPPDSSSSL